MSKIFIHSNAPWAATGYGRQAAILVDQLQALGHEVGVSAFWGLAGGTIEWNGIPVYPGGRHDFGIDVLLNHAGHFGADLVVTLMDTYKMLPAAEVVREWSQETGGRMACWTPVDCTPMGRGDRVFFERSGAVPIAMSQFGYRQMVEAGLSPLYVPHSVNTAVFRPDPLRASQFREQQGITLDQPVIGICGANKDPFRKGFPEQFRAFYLFLNAFPRAQLWVHTQASRGRDAPDLRQLATDMGIAHAVRFTDEYAQVAGFIDDEDLAIWYASLDLLSCCSYAEGFGLPIIEAQACGTPAVATLASAMTELTPYRVTGHEFWNYVHQAGWVRPHAASIASTWEEVYQQQPDASQEAVERAAAYAVDRVTREHWKPALDTLGVAA